MGATRFQKSAREERSSTRSVLFVVRLEGFEPPTLGSVERTGENQQGYFLQNISHSGKSCVRGCPWMSTSINTKAIQRIFVGAMTLIEGATAA